MSRFAVELLAARHDRTRFSCGRDMLDRFLREQAGQDVKRRVSLCYVACEPGDARVAGYYTLSAGEIRLADLPDTLARRLPRYPLVPVARIGRLAIDVGYQGLGLGAALLWDAGLRTLRAEMGVYALVVDAKDDEAAAFYRHHGFLALLSQPHKLFIPAATFANAAVEPSR